MYQQSQSGSGSQSPLQLPSSTTPFNYVQQSTLSLHATPHTHHQHHQQQQQQQVMHMQQQSQQHYQQQMTAAGTYQQSQQQQMNKQPNELIIPGSNSMAMATGGSLPDLTLFHYQNVGGLGVNQASSAGVSGGGAGLMPLHHQHAHYQQLQPHSHLGMPVQQQHQQNYDFQLLQVRYVQFLLIGKKNIFVKMFPLFFV